MQVARTIAEARRQRAGRSDVAFVPTMGALHEGHLSLIRRARELGEYLVVSIFLNPTQFGSDEDLNSYPRTLERDLQHCRAEGVDLVFAPDTDEVYPPDEPEVRIDVPSRTAELEGAHRPGHFIGVCRVVAKLLNIVRPDVACFGRKDYQQLKVIEALAAGLCTGARIEPCHTVREPDGLACSSRNERLSADDRQRALSLSQALGEARRAIENGQNDPAAVEASMAERMRSAGVEVDYAAVRDAETLAPVRRIAPAQQPVVCLVAGRVGGVRLIDNTMVTAGTEALRHRGEHSRAATRPRRAQ